MNKNIIIFLLIAVVLGSVVFYFVNKETTKKVAKDDENKQDPKTNHESLPTDRPIGEEMHSSGVPMWLWEQQHGNDSNNGTNSTTVINRPPPPNEVVEDINEFVNDTMQLDNLEYCLQVCSGYGFFDKITCESNCRAKYMTSTGATPSAANCPDTYYWNELLKKCRPKL